MSLITPIRQVSHIEAAYHGMIEKLKAVAVPRGFSVFPVPSQFAAVADFMRETAGIIDEMYAAIGHEVADNSTVRVDMTVFLSPCTDSIDGNALFEVERSCEALIEDHNEMVRGL